MPRRMSVWTEIAASIAAAAGIALLFFTNKENQNLNQQYVEEKCGRDTITLAERDERNSGFIYTVIPTDIYEAAKKNLPVANSKHCVVEITIDDGAVLHFPLESAEDKGRDYVVRKLQKPHIIASNNDPELQQLIPR